MDNITRNGPVLKVEQSKITPKEGPSFIPLCPFTPPNNTNETTKVPTQNTRLIWYNWSSEINRIIDGFELHCDFAKEVLFRHQSDGSRIIDVSNANQSEELQQLFEAGDSDLNECYGIIIVANGILTESS